MKRWVCWGFLYLMVVGLVFVFFTAVSAQGRYVTDVFQTNSLYEVREFQRQCLNVPGTVFRLEEGANEGDHRWRLACLLDRERTEREMNDD